MSDKCECFKDKLVLVEGHVNGKLPEGAHDLKVSWEGYSYFFSGDFSPVNPKVNIEYRKTKKNGDPAKSLTKDSISMIASFCCYCGRKLKKGEK